MAARVCAARLVQPLRQAPRRAVVPSCRQQFTPTSRLIPALRARSFSASTINAVKKYSEDHEWIELDSDGTTATIGISQYAANALGDVVYVELPQADLEVATNDTIGAVESVKSASDIYSPVSGVVLEANQALEDTPGTINKSPESDGWIVKVKVKDTSELDELMDADAYKKFTEE